MQRCYWLRKLGSYGKIPFQLSIFEYQNPIVEEKIPNFILQNTEKLAKEIGRIRIYRQSQKLKYTLYIHVYSCLWK